MALFRGSPGTPAGLYPPRIACFVCGADVPADYPLYPLPPAGNSGATPHFPFLLSLEPPIGCRPPSPGGVAKSCRVCYSTLMRQWDEYEKSGVSTDRRVYWVKRIEGLPFPTAEAQARLTTKKRNLMGAPAIIPPPATVSLHPSFDMTTTISDRLKNASPLTVATNSAVGSSSPLATPVQMPHSSPSSSVWSRRPLPAQSASSAPSSLFQLSSERGESSLVNVSETDSGALDLSSGSRDRENMKSRSSVASHISHHSSSYQSEGTSAASSSSTNVLTASGASGQVQEVLDLTLPDKNAVFEVCYVCGDEYKRGTLAYTFVKQVVPSEPYYPSLTSHPRPSKSRPIDSAGRIQTCDECHEHLLAQWYSFEGDEVPHADRQYTLRKRQVALVDLTNFVCYICALEYHSSSLRLLYSKPNSENEPYYPFISHQRPPPGASSISPQGLVQVCTMCYKSTKNKHHGFLKADQPPPKKRRGNSHTFSLPRDPGDYFDPSAAASANAAHQQDEEEKALPADVTCPLCRRKFSIGTFKSLHCQPHAGSAYFPFLSELPMPEDYGELEDDKTMRVRACQACTTSLINQWTTYQRDQVPVEERTYVYESPLGPRSFTGGGHRPPTPSSLRSHKSSRSAETSDKLSRPRSTSNMLEAAGVTGTSTGNPGVLASLNNKQVTSVINSNRPRSDTQSPKIPATSSPSQGSNLDPENSNSRVVSRHTSESEFVPTASNSASNSKPAANSSSFYCFLCGLHSELSFSRMLYSSPPGKKAPYFPFMKKHVPKNRAETLREDGTALVCTFCYHSVMVQWTQYNEAKSPRSLLEPSERTYNLHEYRCYVCGIMTYRKRIRALRVMDFPFLRQHKPRKGAITMENGEMVAVCLDCFDSLRGQFIEASKYGIPVEKRQYNWMQIPPPPESESSQLITPQERLSKFSQLISSQEQQRLQAKFARPQALNQASQLPGPGPNVATADKKAGNFSHPVVTVSSGSSQNENEKLQKSNNSES